METESLVARTYAMLKLVLRHRGYQVSDENDITHVRGIVENELGVISRPLVFKNESDEVIEVFYAIADRKTTSGVPSVVNIKKLHDGEFFETLLASPTQEDDHVKKRTVLIISREPPKVEAINACSGFYRQHNIYVQLFWYKNLLFNIMEHKYVPSHEIVSQEEKDTIRKNFNVENDREFPVILHTDPVAMYIGLRPQQLCRITRKNDKLPNYHTYRLCR